MFGCTYACVPKLCVQLYSCYLLSCVEACCSLVAACLITGTRRCEQITPVLRELHWLPVRQRVEFKVGSRCTSHSLSVRYLSILLQTSNSSPTVVAVISVQHLTGDASFHARRISSATDVFCVAGLRGTGSLGA